MQIDPICPRFDRTWPRIGISPALCRPAQPSITRVRLHVAMDRACTRVVSPDLSPRCVVTQIVVRVSTRHPDRLWTPRARGKPYLLSCKIPTTHQTLACAVAVPHEGDSRVIVYMMFIAYVHAHFVLERNRRHNPRCLRVSCSGYAYLLLRAVLHSHRTRMGSLPSPCLASWTVERITLLAHPDQH